MGSEGWRQVKEEAEKQIANSWGSRIVGWREGNNMGLRMN